MTHICVGNPTIVGSANGLSPGRHQAIIWTNVHSIHWRIYAALGGVGGGGGGGWGGGGGGVGGGGVGGGGGGGVGGGGWGGGGGVS